MEEKMRSRAWFTSCLIVLMTMVGGVAIASSRIATEESMTVYTETARYRFVDNGKEGSSVGDHDLYFDAIFSDDGKTDRIGTDRVVVEYMQSTYAMVQLELTIQGRGKIYAAGTLNFSDRFLDQGDDLAIVGGTGEFENVGGSVHLSVFDDETFKNEIHLLP
jgi:hypothetical protein